MVSISIFVASSRLRQRTFISFHLKSSISKKSDERVATRSTGIKTYHMFYKNNPYS